MQLAIFDGQFSILFCRNSKKAADPAKRLWHSLVHQELLRETFLELSFPRDAHAGEVLIKAHVLFSKKIKEDDGDSCSSS